MIVMSLLRKLQHPIAFCVKSKFSSLKVIHNSVPFSKRSFTSCFFLSHILCLCPAGDSFPSPNTLRAKPMLSKQNHPLRNSLSPSLLCSWTSTEQVSSDLPGFMDHTKFRSLFVFLNHSSMNTSESVISTKLMFNLVYQFLHKPLLKEKQNQSPQPLSTFSLAPFLP